MRHDMVHDDDIRVHPVVAGGLLFAVILVFVWVESTLPESLPPSQTDRQYLDAMVHLDRQMLLVPPVPGC